MRYRYIVCGMWSPDEQVREFRLISHRELHNLTKLPGGTYVRIHIPDDLVLEKYSCDTYSTTEDERTIETLGYDVFMTMWNGKQEIIPKDADMEVLKEEQHAKWFESMMENRATAYHPYEFHYEPLDSIIDDAADRSKETSCESNRDFDLVKE